MRSNILKKQKEKCPLFFKKKCVRYKRIFGLLGKKLNELNDKSPPNNSLRKIKRDGIIEKAKKKYIQQKTEIEKILTNSKTLTTNNKLKIQRKINSIKQFSNMESQLSKVRQLKKSKTSLQNNTSTKSLTKSSNKNLIKSLRNSGLFKSNKQIEEEAKAKAEKEARAKKIQNEKIKLKEKSLYYF